MLWKYQRMLLGLAGFFFLPSRLQVSLLTFDAVMLLHQTNREFIFKTAFVPSISLDSLIVIVLPRNKRGFVGVFCLFVCCCLVGFLFVPPWNNSLVSLNVLVCDFWFVYHKPLLNSLV